MRLSDVLSKAPDTTPHRSKGSSTTGRSKWGKHKRIKVGKVFHNFHCRTVRRPADLRVRRRALLLGTWRKCGQHRCHPAMLCHVRRRLKLGFLLQRGDIAGFAPKVRLKGILKICGTVLTDRIGPQASSPT